MTSPANRPASAPRISTPRKLAFALGLLLIVVLIGVYGFKTLVPQNTWVDSVYMTVITLSTVGYGEVHPLDPAAKLFACALIIGGVTSLSLVVTLAAGVVIEDVLSHEIGRRRMEKKIRQLREHFVICGCGPLGNAVAEAFRREKIPFVIVEADPRLTEEAFRRGDLVYQGDPTDDEVLEAVGVPHARCLIAVAASDAENVYIALSARQMNAGISIIAGAEDENAATKLRRAGANRVVNPYLMGATRAANAALRPTVIDFMDAMMGGAEEYGFRIEERVVEEKSEVAGKTIGSLNLSQRVGVIIVGIVRQGGRLIFNPSGKTELLPGDILIVIGTEKQLEGLGGLLKEA